MKRKRLYLPLVILFTLMACHTMNKNHKEAGDIDKQQPKDELWKQFMKVRISDMEKTPPDSNCFVILNHKKVSYYKKNILEFSDDLIEYLINDSLIVYRLTNKPNIQIGYNRKDSVVLLTTGHPEGGGNPTGEMQYFAKKVDAPSPFNR